MESFVSIKAVSVKPLVGLLLCCLTPWNEDPHEAKSSFKKNPDQGLAFFFCCEGLKRA